MRSGSLTNEDALEKIKLEHSLGSQGEISRAQVAQVLVRTLHDGGASNVIFKIIKGETSIRDALTNVQVV